MKTNFWSRGLTLLLSTCAGCDIPQDAAESFNHAIAHELRVGFSINPPFVAQGTDGFSGTEVQLIRQFAAEHDLEVDLQSAAESQLLRRLEQGKLDLVAGGFDKDTVWKEQAGTSAPYDGQHVILVRGGENRLLFELETSLRRSVRQ